MAYNFPDTPTIGTKYQGYTWDGEKWLWTSGGGAVRYDVAQGLTRDQQAQARSNIGALKKNYILNGGMQISQEWPLTLCSSTALYAMDQFLTQFTTTGTVNYSQVASRTPAGSTHRYQIKPITADTSIAAGEYLEVSQRLEGLRVADLYFGTASAKTVTIQFGVKAPAGTYSVVLSNAAGNRTYVAEYVITAGEGGNDVVKSVTIPGCIDGTWPVDSNYAMEVRWGLITGTTWQQAAGAWGTVNAVGSPNQSNFMASTSNVFELFDVSLTEGNVASPFQVPDYPSELTLCQRYFESWEAPGTGWSIAAVGAALATNMADHPFTFKVVKRAPPTLTGTASSTFSVLYAGFVSTAACISIAILNTTNYGTMIRGSVSGSPLTVGACTGIGATNPQTAKLFFSARL